MPIDLANPRRVALEVTAQALTPPPPVDFEAWAIRHIVFGNDSPFPGPYNAELFGYFSEILKALGPDDPCRTVTFAKSAQLGGTVLANIFVLGAMEMAPSNILYVHPTADNATRWSKLKLKPMLKSTAALRRIFASKSRDGADSVLHKERIDGKGSILISGANSPASLSQVSMPRQVQDDLAKWELNAAGDPEPQADSRTRAFEFGKIFKISTPMVLPGCRITRNFEAGSQEYLYVPCPHCAHMQVLEWENFRANLDEEHPERSCFSCVSCGGVIEEHHRPQMIRGGEWRAHNPKARREHRSFMLWSAYSVLQSFERIAREWLNVRGDPAREQTFENDTLGRAYRAAGESPPWEDLRKRADEIGHQRGSIPAGHAVLTLGIDVQKDFIAWQAVAWARDNRRAVVDHGVIDGHISELHAQAALDALLEMTFPSAEGHRIASDLAAIDGNYSTEDVWNWVRRHPVSKVIMVRGIPDDRAPLIAVVKRERNRQTGKLLNYSRRFYNFAASVMKMTLYRNLMKADPLDRGFVSIPRGLSDEYFRELTAERRAAVRRKDGHVSYQWVKDSGQANEMLDTMNQAAAAFTKLIPPEKPDARWDYYEGLRMKPAEPSQLDLEDMLARPAVPPLPASIAKPSGPRTGFGQAARRLNGNQ